MPSEHSKKRDTEQSDIADILRLISDAKLKKEAKTFFLIKLAQYIQEIEKIDKIIAEGKKVAEEFWPGFNKLCSEIIREGDKITTQIKNRIVTKRIKDRFRTIVGYWLYKGKLAERGYIKPRGYPGDYKTLEGMYDNKPWTKNGVGYLYDRLLLEDSYVWSVRRRKDKMREILGRFLQEHQIGNINIMDLGCGSAREVRELFASGTMQKNRVNFTFVDQDGEALDFVRDEIQKLKISFLNCIYLKENLATFANTVNTDKDKLNTQDLIYMIGVIDYLPDIFCQRILGACFELLKKNGKLVVAYKLVKEVKSLYSDWFCDWNFYPRDDQEIIRLVADCLDKSKVNLDITNKSDKRIHFIEVTKAVDDRDK